MSAARSILRRSPVILLAFGLVAGSLQAIAGAGHRPAQNGNVRSAVASGELLPLPKILALAQARVPGEMLEVELERDDGRILYEIKILASANGRVREVKLDAHTGALIEIEDD